MDITHLAYLGPAGHKTVTGIEFPRDVPVAVTPRQAKSILRYWPNSFVGLMDCPNYSKTPQPSQEPQEAASPVEVEQPEPELPEDAPEPVQEVKKNKGGRPRKE